MSEVQTSNNDDRRILATGINFGLEWEEVTSLGSLECGFRQGWLDAGRQGQLTEATLAAGAGVGSPWIIANVRTEDGVERTFRADVRPLFNKIINAVIDGDELGEATA